MKTRFTNYLHFSRHERLGAFALLILCIGVFLTPSLLQWWRPRTTTDFSALEATMTAFRQIPEVPTVTGTCFDFDPNLASAEDFKALGLPEKVAQNICHYREKGGSFRKPEDFKKIWSLQPKDYDRLLPYIHISTTKTGGKTTENSPEHPEYFPFNPNTATEADFFKLGLPNRTIKSILHYRANGGVFRRKEDLAKIYTLDEADYTRIEPYITFPNSPASTDSPKLNAYASNGNFKSQKTKGPVDINKADVATWMSLPLIGEKRAQQIVNFREKLGGFRSVDQLAEMYNLPDSVFQLIKPQLLLETVVIHKINLNTTTAEALDAHPYISRKQADLIIAYRSQHGKFSSPEEVLNIKAFTDKTWWDKVSPYLATE